MANLVILPVLLISIIEGVAQVFIYSKLVNKKISLITAIVLPILSFTSYFLFYYAVFIITILYFLIMGKRVIKERNNNLIWFYAIYTIFSYAIFGYLMNSTILLFIGENTFNQYMYLINLTISPLFSVVCNLILLRILRPSISFLEKNQDSVNQYFFLLINILLTICYTIQVGNYWIEQFLLTGTNPIRKYLIAIFILIIVLLVVYLNKKTRELDKQRLQQLKDNQLADLTSYVQQIESMYNELRSFRHDYHNVLISLNESIKSKDISVIESTYKQILDAEGIILADDHYSLGKLDNLKTLPIKGIFSTHIIQAWQKNIPVHLEINNTIQDEPIEILDYVRITSILLDNAIEAAEKSEKPFLTIVFLKDEPGSELQLIIENACPDESIDITKIFKKDYSTKGKNRGLGLATVHSILQNYPNLSLQTEYQTGLFRQVLIIKEELPQ